MENIKLSKIKIIRVLIINFLNQLLDQSQKSCSDYERIIKIDLPTLNETFINSK